MVVVAAIIGAGLIVGFEAWAVHHIWIGPMWENYKMFKEETERYRAIIRPKRAEEKEILKQNKEIIQQKHECLVFKHNKVFSADITAHIVSFLEPNKKVGALPSRREKFDAWMNHMIDHGF